MKHILLIAGLFIAGTANAQNNPPVAVDDTIYITSGQQISFNPRANDYDPDGDTFMIDTLLYTTGIGAVQNIAGFVVWYFSDSSYVGMDTIPYVICDNGVPSMCDTGLILIWITKFKMYEAYQYLDTNNISARFNADGTMFWDLQGVAQFEVPKGSGIYSIFAGAPWIGGFSSQLHFAGTQYNGNGRDFWPGPVMDSLHYSSSQDSLWNKLWKVNRSDIDYHRNNWWKPGYVMPQVFIDWPAHGDTSKGQAYYLAPFRDYDNDGEYNPYNGDYPEIRGDQTVYFIFNDDRDIHTETGGNKLRVEIHAMAYAMDCQFDSALYNTIFVNYRIINRSAKTYDSTYFGAFVDFDLGCYMDDYVGSDVQRSSFYVYNGNLIDNDCAGANGYGNNPPAQGTVVLAGPFQNPDGIDNPYGIGAGESINGFGFGDGIIDNERHGMTSFSWFGNGGPTGDPNTAIQYYNYMKGFWKDGTPLLYGGNGHINNGGDPNVPAKFMFPDDTDPLGWGTAGVPQPPWNETIVGNTPADRRGIGCSGPFTFAPNQVEEVDLAFVFGRDYVNPLPTAGIVVMQQRIDAIRQMFVNDSTPCGMGLFTALPEPVKTTPVTEIQLYPNPAKDILYVKFGGRKGTVNYSIYDLLGRKIKSGKLVSDQNTIDLLHLKAGLYLIRFTGQAMTESRKFIRKN